MSAGEIELHALTFERVGSFHCSSVEVRDRQTGRVLHSWPLRVRDDVALAYRLQRTMERAVQMYMGTTRALNPVIL